MPHSKRASEGGGGKPTKRQRSSLHHTKNSSWDFAPRHRRLVATHHRPASGLRQAFGSIIVPCDDGDDVDVVAAALLAMGCPDRLSQDQKGVSLSLSPRKYSLAPEEGATIPATKFLDLPYQFPVVRVEACASVPVYPRLIISSKSNASDESSATDLELKPAAGGPGESIQSKGLAGQPAQNVFKLGEPVEYSPAESALGKIKWDGHSQEVHPRSRACQYVNPYLTMGATISTGISQILTNTGEKQPVPAAGISNEPAKWGGSRIVSNAVAKEPRSAKPLTRETPMARNTTKHLSSPTHPVAQQKLQQPVVRSRGGRLIVLPDMHPSPRSNPPSSPEALPAILASKKQQIARQLGNVPLQQRADQCHLPLPAPLVFAKASQPRVQTFQTSPQSAPGVAAPAAIPAGRERQPSIVPRQQRLLTVRSEPRMSKPHSLEQGTGSTQNGSSEESCEDAWQPGWGLSLFSALNPNVITTGLSIASQGRSSSQPLEAK